MHRITDAAGSGGPAAGGPAGAGAGPACCLQLWADSASLHPSTVPFVQVLSALVKEWRLHVHDAEQRKCELDEIVRFLIGFCNVSAAAYRAGYLPNLNDAPFLLTHDSKPGVSRLLWQKADVNSVMVPTKIRQALGLLMSALRAVCNVDELWTLEAVDLFSYAAELLQFSALGQPHLQCVWSARDWAAVAPAGPSLHDENAAEIERAWEDRSPDSLSVALLSGLHQLFCVTWDTKSLLPIKQLFLYRFVPNFTGVLLRHNVKLQQQLERRSRVHPLTTWLTSSPFHFKSPKRASRLRSSRLAGLELTNVLHTRVFHNCTTALASLDLSHNSLTNLVLEDVFQALVSLSVLDLSHNRLASVASPLLRGLANLHTLLLSHNPIIYVLDGAFEATPLLTTLDLSYNTGAFPLQLQPLAFVGLLSLAKLNLDLSPIDNGILPRQPTASLSNLVEFRAVAAGIQQVESGTWEALQQLKFIDLSRNPIVDACPALSNHVQAHSCAPCSQSAQVRSGNCTICPPGLCQPGALVLAAPISRRLPLSTATLGTFCATVHRRYRDFCFIDASATLNSWANNAAYCSTQNAQLVSIHSNAEFDFWARAITGTIVPWTGLNDQTTLGQRVWSDGTEYDYDLGRPSVQYTGTTRCVRSTGSAWSKQDCTASQSYACKMAPGTLIGLLSCGASSPGLSARQAQNQAVTGAGYWLNSQHTQSGLGRGLTVFVWSIYQPTNAPVVTVYDTSVSSTAGTSLLTYLSNIASGYFVAIACFSDCAGQLTTPQKSGIAAYCGSSISSIASQGSYLCMFTKNVVVHFDGVSNDCMIQELVFPICPVGKYLALDGSGASSCVSCAAGTYSVTEAATTSSVCVACTAGTYSPNSDVGCIPCPIGKFAPQAGQTACGDCPTGMWADVGSSTCSAHRTAFCGNNTMSKLGKCYFSDYLPRIWSDARSMCLARKADLVSIHGDTIASWLELFNPIFSRFWIGLSSPSAAPFAFQWSDGSPLDYTRWLTGQPAGSGLCTALNYQFVYPSKWGNVACDTTYPGICAQDPGTLLKFYSCGSSGNYEFYQSNHQFGRTGSNYQINNGRWMHPQDRAGFLMLVFSPLTPWTGPKERIHKDVSVNTYTLNAAQLLLAISAVAAGDIVALLCNSDCQAAFSPSQKATIMGYCGSGFSTVSAGSSFLCVFTKGVATHINSVYSNRCIVEELLVPMCVAGRYAVQSASGATSCTACVSGQYSVAGATSPADCYTCGAGAFTPTGAPGCSLCPAGKYSTSGGVTSCTFCSVGFSSSAGSSTCVDTQTFTSCPTGWVAYGNKCYSSDGVARTWSDSSTACAAYNAQLASVHSPDELSFLLEQYGRQSLWLGGTDAAIEGKWAYSDSTPWDYAFMSYGFDDADGTEDCLVLAWDLTTPLGGDIACSQKAPSLCKIQSGTRLTFFSCGNIMSADLAAWRAKGIGTSGADYVVNDVPAGPTTGNGFNVYVFAQLKPYQGHKAFSRFDTGSSSAEGPKLITYLAGVAIGDVVVILCVNDCAGLFDAPSKTSLATICGSQASSIGRGDSYVCVYIKGVQKLLELRSSTTCLAPEMVFPLCPAGSYGVLSGAGTTSCTQCAAGTFSALPGSTTCTTCATGSYSSAGSSSCYVCGPGTRVIAGTTTCNICPRGKYSTVTGATICSYCPVGQTTLVVGSNACVPTAPALNCPSNWVQFNGACYFSDKTRKSWIQAEADCAVANARIASIHSNAELELVWQVSGLDAVVWTGANDIDVYATCGKNTLLSTHLKHREGAYVWSDGSAWDYYFLEPSNLDIAGGTLDCATASIRTLGFHWGNMDVCTNTHYATCKVPMGTSLYLFSCGNTMATDLAGWRAIGVGLVGADYAVNNVPSNPPSGTGFTVLVFSVLTPYNGHKAADVFNTATTSTEGPRLISYLSAVGTGDLIAILCFDDCVAELDKTSKASLATTYCPGIFALATGNSYACVFIKGGRLLLDKVSSTACVLAEIVIPLCTAGYYSTLTGITTSCVACAAGTYSPQPGASVCASCPGGTFGSATGSSACSTCGAGQFSNPGSTMCGSCGAGFYCNNGIKTACPAGTFSTATTASSIATCANCAAGLVAATTGQSVCTNCAPGLFAPSAGTSVCSACPAGTYNVGGGLMSVCTNCAAGTFSTSTGLTAASDCTACPAGTVNVNTGVTVCSPCSAGRYSTVTGASLTAFCVACDVGKYSSSGSTALSSCTSCAAGTYGPSAGATDISACTQCPVGTYGTASAASSLAACTQCAAGTYADLTGTTQCSACAVGRFSTTSGATSGTVCIECAAGTYAAATGLTVCSPCAQGTYSTRSGLSASSQCSSCPMGSFGTTTGQTLCSLCRQGTYGLIAAATSSAVCQLCPTGTYGLVQGGAAVTNCTSCPAGTASAATGSTTASVCQTCPTGTFSTSGASACTSCSAGAYNPSTGSSSASACLLCPAGSYAAAGASQCTNCTAGSFSPSRGAGSIAACSSCFFGTFSGSGAGSCEPCGVGTYAGAMGLTTCDPCTPGKFASGTQRSTCSDCAKGSYASGFGSSVCSVCTAGKYGTVEGAASSGACQACAAGAFTAEAGLTVCEACAPGSYMLSTGASRCTPCGVGKFGTATRASVSSVCQSCAAGTFGNTTGLSQCIPCPANTASGVVGATSNSTCTACPTGKFSSSGSAECADCPAGTFKQNGVCVACSPGSYSRAGQAACSPCEPGTWGSSTGLSACTLCTAGKYSTHQGATEALVCAQCTPGNYSNAGAAACSRCPVGTASATVAASSLAKCMPCAAGLFSNQTGLSACEACAPGFVSLSAAATQCSACSAGTYSRADNAACAGCPLGRFGTLTAASSVQQCNACATGTFGPTAGLTACEHCPIGTWSNATAAVAASTCSLCPIGRFASAAGSTTCLVCPVGTYTPLGGAASCIAFRMPRQPPPMTDGHRTGGQAQVYLHVPQDTGGLPILRFAVFLLSGTDLQPLFNVSVLGNAVNASAVVLELTASTTYSLQYLAVNAMGSGMLSGVHSFTTNAVTPPAAVQAIRTANTTGGMIAVEWQAPLDQGGTPVSGYTVVWTEKVSRRVVGTDTTRLPACRRYDLLVNTAYEVRIVAQNALYAGTATLYEAVTQSFPTPPSAASIGSKSATGGALTVGFTPPTDKGGVPIIGYLVQARAMDAATDASWRTVYFSNTSASLEGVAQGGLVASVLYAIKVLALTALYQPFNTLVTASATVSPHSAVVTMSNVQVLPAVGDTVQLGDQFFSVLQVQANSLTLDAVVSTSTTSPLSMYLLGHMSDTVAMSTAPVSLPAPPPAPRIVGGTGGAAQVQLSSPLDTGGAPITEFEVQVRNASSLAWTAFSDSRISLLGSSVIAWIIGLQPATTYQIRCAAINRASQCSTERNMGPAATVRIGAASAPTSPLDLIMVSRSGGAVSVKWNVPLDDGGDAVTQYRLLSNSGTASPTTTVYLGPARSFTLGKLFATTTYTFAVVAENNVGSSPLSALLVTETTVLTLPGPPTNIVAQWVTGGAIHVTWTAPVDTGGLPLAAGLAEITRLDAASAVITLSLAGNATSLVVGDLLASTPYRIVLAASNNGAHMGTASLPLSVTTLSASTPSAPGLPALQGRTGGSLSISWTPPLDKGGALISEFRILVNGVVYATAAGSATSTTLYGLAALTTFSVTVAAMNGAGIVGVPSASAAMRTDLASLPSAPRNLQVTASAGALSLSWDAPQDEGGSPVQSYQVYLKTAGSKQPAQLAATFVSRTGVLGHLGSQLSYAVQVTAVNSVGESALSAAVSATTAQSTAPSAPVITAVTQVEAATSLVAWSPPQDNGGLAIEWVVLRYRQVSQQAWTETDSIAASRSTISVLSLALGQTYEFQLCAVNSIGRGAWSAVFLFTFPKPAGAPQSATSGQYSSKFATVTWAAPFAVPNVVFTGFVLYIDRYDGNGWAVVDAGIPITTLQYVVSGLTAGQRYRFAVAARNSTVSQPSRLLSGGSISTGPLTITADILTPHDVSAKVLQDVSGTLASEAYGASTNSTWILRSSTLRARLTLSFEQFDLECDHDRVEVGTMDGQLLWKGGCKRKAFNLGIASLQAVSLRLISDSSVHRTGFVVKWLFDDVAQAAQTLITATACPVQTVTGVACTSTTNGACTGTGQCFCNTGFTGEDCSGVVFCPGHFLCSRLSTVAIVTPTGSDLATGAAMQPVVHGTVPKPLGTIAAALAVPGASTVLLYPGTYSTAVCDLNVVNSGKTILSLNGSSLTTIDCGRTKPFARITGGSLSMIGLHVKRGFTATNGGCVSVGSGTLTMQDMVLANCQARGRGGAMHVAPSATVSGSGVVVRDSVAAVDGGGLLVQGLLSLQSSLLTNNSAPTGGGMVVERGRVQGGITLFSNKATVGGNVAVTGLPASTITGATLDSGKASAFGGNVAVVSGSAVALVSCILQNGQASVGAGLYVGVEASAQLTGDNVLERNAAGSMGGGLFVDLRGLVTIADDLTVTSNTAVLGGGVFLANSSQLAGDTHIDSNYATHGAGFYAAWSTALGQALITANDANDSGGGGYCAGSCTLNQVTLSRNKASSGGGLWVQRAAVARFTGGCVVTRNHADTGGGVVLESSTLVGGPGDDISDNEATHEGGCVRMTDGARLENVAVSSCTADISGGGLFIAESSSVVLRHVNISDSNAVNGGGIHIAESSDVNAANLHILACDASARGGGAFLSAGSRLIGAAVTLSGNTAIDSGGNAFCDACALVAGPLLQRGRAHNGGGIAVHGHSNESPVLSTVSIVNNVATFGGGVFAQSVDSLRMSDVVVHNNSAVSSGGSGGGVYAEQSTLIHHTLIVGSNAASGTGGGITLHASSLMPESQRDIAVILRNIANAGGGVAMQGSASTLHSALVSSCRAAAGGGGVLMQGSQHEAKDISVAACSAGTGGGFALKSSLDVVFADVLVTNCSAESGGTFGGQPVCMLSVCVDAGGISLQASSLSGSSSTVVQGCVATDGGAVAVFGNSALASMLLVNGSASDGGGACYVQGTVQLTDLDMQRSRAAEGGCLYMDVSGSASTSVTVTDTSFWRCTASSEGGGVYIGVQATGTLVDSSIQESQAASGGGIATFGQLYLRRSNVTMNGARNSGGGLLADSTSGPVTADVSRCRFIGNHADTAGGAIAAVSGTTLLLQDSILIENRGRNGGGVIVSSSAAGIVGCEFSGRSTTQITVGGGIYFSGLPTNALFTSYVRETRFVDLVADSGAAMYVSDTRLHLQVLQIRSCTAPDFGGGMYLMNAEVYLYTSHIDHCSSGFDGGGIFSYKTSLHVQDVQVTQCAGSQGGGVFVTVGSKLTATRLLLSSNIADVMGGAMYIDRGVTAELSACSMMQNSAGECGGGFLIVDAEDVRMSGGLISHNRASSGAGVCVKRVAQIALSNTTVTGNEASDVGAGVLVADNAKASLTRCIVSNNAAAVGGGGIHVDGTIARIGGRVATLVLESTVVEGNTATLGGGILTQASSFWKLSAVDSWWASNTAVQAGGGAYFAGNGSADVRKCSFVGNSALAAGSAVGGAVTIIDSLERVHISNSRFSHNQAFYGGGVYWSFNPAQPAVVFKCAGCSFAANAMYNNASTPLLAAFGGVQPSGRVRSGVMFSKTASTAIAVHVLDHSRQRVLTDKVSSCVVSSVTPSSGQVVGGTVTAAAGSAGNVLRGAGGVMDFGALALKGTVGSEYAIETRCNLQGITNPVVLEMTLTVAGCAAGQALQNGVCTACRDSTYSPEGKSCLRCPDGASCSKEVAEVDPVTNQTTVSYVGVQLPIAQAGYWLYWRQESTYKSTCDAFIAKQADCLPGEEKSGGLCVQSSDDANIVYACLTGFQLYACAVASACRAESSNASEAFANVCNVGYRGPMCSLCVDGYTRDATGACNICAGSDASVTRAQYALLVAFVAMVFVAVLVVYLCGLEHMCKRRWVQAVRQANVSTFAQSQPTVRSGCLSMLATQLKVLKFWLRPEKIKMIVGFIQIIAGFKECYSVRWPSQASFYMTFWNGFNFDIFRLGSFDCIVPTRFFTTFMFMFFAPISLGLLLLGFYFVARRAFLSNLAACETQICAKPRVDQLALHPHHQMLMKLWRRTRLQQLPSKRQVAEYQFDEPLPVGLGDAVGEPRVTAEKRALHLWALYCREDDLNPTIGARLCECISRDSRFEGHNADMLCERGQIQWRILEFRNRTIQLFLWILLFAYTPLAAKTLRMWDCVQIGRTYYLATDYKITCDTAEYAAFATWAGVSAALYIAGIPLMFLLLVHRQRNRHVDNYLSQLDGKLIGARSTSSHGVFHTICLRLLTLCYRGADWLSQVLDLALGTSSKHIPLGAMFEGREAELQLMLAAEKEALLKAALADCARLGILPSRLERDTIRGFLYRDNLESYHTKSVVGFLYFAYTTQFWWYEIVYLVRKLFLNGIVIFLASAESQLLVSLLFCFFAVCLQLAVDPYKAQADNSVQSVLVVQLFLTLFAGMLTYLQNPAESSNAATSHTAVVDALGWGIVGSNLLSLIVSLVLIGREAAADYAEAEAEERQARLANGSTKPAVGSTAQMSIAHQHTPARTSTIVVGTANPLYKHTASQ